MNRIRARYERKWFRSKRNHRQFWGRRDGDIGPLLSPNQDFQTSLLFPEFLSLDFNFCQITSLLFLALLLTICTILLPALVFEWNASHPHNSTVNRFWKEWRGSISFIFSLVKLYLFVSAFSPSLSFHFLGLFWFQLPRCVLYSSWFLCFLCLIFFILAQVFVQSCSLAHSSVYRTNKYCKLCFIVDAFVLLC